MSVFLPKKKKSTKGHRKLGKALDMSISLMVVMVSGIYTYVKTHQIMHITCAVLCISTTPQ